MTLKDIERAIKTVEFSRQTHETWLTWLEIHPEQEEDVRTTAGDRQWHKEAIEGYDHVLSVLRYFLDRSRK